MSEGINTFIPYLRFEKGGDVPLGPSQEARDQAARLTLIEMQMEPGAREIFDNNPYARLGLDILERGEFPDQDTADFGARLKALIIGEGDVIPSNTRGQFIPSDSIGYGSGYDNVEGLSERGIEALARQGVTDPEVPRSEGSTVYYLASGLPDEEARYTGRKRTLQIIAHELGHLGYMALQKKNMEKRGNIGYAASELALDKKDFDSAVKLGFEPQLDDIAADENLKSDKKVGFLNYRGGKTTGTYGQFNRDILRRSERDAYNMMRDRGMPLISQGPPKPPPPEPERGIGAKLLEMLGLQ